MMIDFLPPVCKDTENGGWRFQFVPFEFSFGSGTEVNWFNIIFLNLDFTFYLGKVIE